MKDALGRSSRCSSSAAAPTSRSRRCASSSARRATHRGARGPPARRARRRGEGAARPAGGRPDVTSRRCRSTPTATDTHDAFVDGRSTGSATSTSCWSRSACSATRSRGRAGRRRRGRDRAGELPRSGRRSRSRWRTGCGRRATARSSCCRRSPASAPAGRTSCTGRPRRGSTRSSRASATRSWARASSVMIVRPGLRAHEDDRGPRAGAAVDDARGAWPRRSSAGLARGSRDRVGAAGAALGDGGAAPRAPPVVPQASALTCRKRSRSASSRRSTSTGRSRRATTCCRSCAPAVGRPRLARRRSLATAPRLVAAALDDGRRDARQGRARAPHTHRLRRRPPRRGRRPRSPTTSSPATCGADVGRAGRVAPEPGPRARHRLGVVHELPRPDRRRGSGSTPCSPPSSRSATDGRLTGELAGANVRGPRRSGGSTRGSATRPACVRVGLRRQHRRPRAARARRPGDPGRRTPRSRELEIRARLPVAFT